MLPIAIGSLTTNIENSPISLLQLQEQRPWTDREWIDTMVREGKISPHFRKHYDTLVKGLDTIYPDSWDFRVSVRGSGYGTIRQIILEPVIKFERVEIKNSSGNTHQIEDLFVRVPIKQNYFEEHESYKFYIDIIQGIRTTLTDVEFHAQYSHSHLSRVAQRTFGTNNHDFSAFCVGQGEINNLTMILNSKANNMNLEQATLDENVWILFLLHLKGYLSWESLEGGPYITMSSLGDGNGIIPSYSEHTCEIVFDKYRNFYEEWEKLDLDYVWTPRGYLIVDNEKLEDSFLKYKALNREFKGYLVRKCTNGRYTTVEERSPIPQNFEQYLWKGERHSFQVRITDAGSTVSLEKLYINPTIKSYVKRKLEERINFQTVRNSIVASASKA